MIPFSFFAGAASGAATSWVLRSRQAEAEVAALRLEIEGLRGDRSETERSLAEALAERRALDARLALQLDVLEAARGETRAALEQAEVHRRAAAVTVAEVLDEGGSRVAVPRDAE